MPTAKFGGAWTLPAARVAKTLIFCLFVCLSVTLLNDGVSAYGVDMKLLEYRNGFDTIG